MRPRRQTAGGVSDGRRCAAETSDGLSRRQTAGGVQPRRQTAGGMRPRRQTAGGVRTSDWRLIGISDIGSCRCSAFVGPIPLGDYTLSGCLHMATESFKNLIIFSHVVLGDRFLGDRAGR